MANTNDLTDLFLRPPSQYSLVPFWAWNGEMKPEILLDQLRLMKEQGISQFVIMAFWPLRISYCEGEWWDRIALVLEFCRQEGMKAWIYDDYSWPSGACGGKLLRDKPWTRNVVMGYLALQVAPGETVSQGIDGTLLAASVQTSSDDRIIDVSDAVRSREQIGEKTTAMVEWRNDLDEPVRLYLFVRNVTDELLNFGVGAPWSWAQRGYLNTLDPAAVEAFVESTYEEYAKRFGDSFGREIVGFFTDEPALSYHGTTYGGTCFPYTDGLFDSFRDRHGYDLRSRLPELLQDIGDYRKTRSDFWSHATAQFTNSYHRTLRQWCDRHDLLLMGHPVWEEALGWNIIFSGDIYEGNKWYHAPGFDLLQTNTSFDRTFNENSIHIGIEPGALAGTAKIEESTARHSGSPRMLCEAYSVDPWSMTLEDQRKVTDWITGLGANLIVDCLIPYATHGFLRNRLCGKNLYNPWWKHYGLFNSYAARMCAIAAECSLKADIGVMFPMTSAHGMFNEHIRNHFILLDENRNTPWGIMQQSLYFVSDELLKTHWDYEFVFDSVFDACRVENGKLIAPHSAYSVLVLPGVVSLTAVQLDRIASFVRSGGTLVLVAAVPEFSSDGKADVKGVMAELVQMENVKLLPHSAVLAGDAAALDDMLKSVRSKEVTIEGPSARDIMKIHRSHAGRDVVLLANQSGERAEVSITFSLQGAVEVWDTFTARRFDAELGEGAVRRLNYNFAPHESILLVTDPAGGATAQLPSLREKSWHAQTVVERQTLDGPWEFSPERENMFLPDWMVRVDKDGSGEELGWHRDETDERWLPSKWSEAEVHLDPDHNQYYWLKTRIQMTDECRAMGLVVDMRSECAAVYVNGTKVAPPTPCTLWDPENGRFDIGKHMVAGENVIFVKNHIPTWHGSSKTIYIVDYKEIDPPVVVGEFEIRENESLQPAHGAKTDMRSGSWHTQGYRNHAGTGVYRKTLRIDSPTDGERSWLDLGKVGDIAEVWLNERRVETLPLPPFEADLTDFVTAGENRLEIRVTNNFGNLMFGMWTGRIRHYTPAGLLTAPVLIRTRR